MRACSHNREACGLHELSQLKLRVPTRLIAIVISSELLLLLGIAEAVTADARLGDTAVEAERVFRASEAYDWALTKGATSDSELPPSHSAEFFDYESVDSNTVLVVGRRSVDRRQHLRAPKLSLDVAGETSAVSVEAPTRVRVRIGSTIMYRDPSNGCWRLPPPFGPRCWYP